MERKAEEEEGKERGSGRASEPNHTQIQERAESESQCWRSPRDPALEPRVHQDAHSACQTHDIT